MNYANGDYAEVETLREVRSMKAQWKDYKYGSWLVLVFGSVDAKIVDLSADGTRWGIITHPAGTREVFGTLGDAKATAETMLTEVLTAALLNLKGE